MFLEIVTPEAILFSSEVDSLSVPGINGEFQMLKDHAAVISSLKKGIVKIGCGTSEVNELYKDKFFTTDDNKLGFKINSGVLELKNNKIILLAD